MNNPIPNLDEIRDINDPNLQRLPDCHSYGYGIQVTSASEYLKAKENGISRFGLAISCRKCLKPL